MHELDLALKNRTCSRNKSTGGGRGGVISLSLSLSLTEEKEEECSTGGIIWQNSKKWDMESGT